MMHSLLAAGITHPSAVPKSSEEEKKKEHKQAALRYRILQKAATNFHTHLKKNNPVRLLNKMSKEK